MIVDTQAKAAIRPSLKTFLGDAIANAVLAELDGKRDLRSALKTVVTDPVAQQKARLITDICEITSLNVPLLVALLREVPTSVQDVARHHFDSDSVTTTVEETPTAVLLGLITRGVIGVPEAPVRNLVKACLDESLQSQYRIDTTSVKSLFHDSKALASVDESIREKAKSFLKTLQKLQALVRTPQQISNLINASFDSAQSIAECDLGSFISIMESVDLDYTMACRIHDQASTIELRNAQTWTLGPQQRDKWVLPQVIAMEDPIPVKSLHFAAEKATNMTNHFRDMDTVACEECASVLSPAAYLVDLLRLLRKTAASRDRDSKESLLDVLLDRRPDLQNVGLSCSNTKLTISYLNLVNEVLEAHISSLNGNPSAKDVPQNIFSDKSNDHKEAPPPFINISVYKDALQKQVFPMAVFPYDYSIDGIRSLLAASGTSRYDVLKTLYSPERLLSQYPHLKDSLMDMKAAQQLRDQAQTLISRSLAAELLNLQQGDYMAICGEAFYPVELWLACQSSPVVDVDGEYKTVMGVPSVCQLWGYVDSNTMLDEENCQGLTFIKSQLLSRAGINLKELQAILETHFIRRRVYITTAFVRLWRKIGWSNSELDCILSVLRREKSNASTTRALNADSSITPDILQDLAAVKELSTISGLSPAALQPLWGNINTNGPDSLYSQLFLQKHLITLDPAFKPDETTGVIMANAICIEKHKLTLLTSLGIREQNFSPILSCANLSLQSKLSLQNVSIIYRISLVCDMFSIKPAQYSDLCTLIPNKDWLSGPVDTLEAFVKMRKLLDNGWTLVDLKRVTGGDLSENEAKAASKAVARLQSAVMSIDTAYPAALDSSLIAQPETVDKSLALLFQPSTSQSIYNLIEGA
ncbi:toxin subunit protein [Colletotrichum truncatum]|uniref:Toxin subunit protein n=1 Tax=Colletotrichum truncatum TaxID=5467 RepID=A0ACC3YC35_COLTU